MGYLEWPPSEFWAATIWDVVEAMEGYAERKGLKLSSGSEAPLEEADPDVVAQTLGGFLSALAKRSA